MYYLVFLSVTQQRRRFCTQYVYATEHTTETAFSAYVVSATSSMIVLRSSVLEAYNVY